MSHARIELHDIHQSYASPDGGSTEVIKGISLTLDQPGINMLLGPSGCGKSTLLRMMGGVRPFGVKTPTSGTITIDGQPCNDAHDDAIMVFQQYANRPDLTVRENVIFPFSLSLWKHRVPRAEWAPRVDAMLQAVGLADKRDLYPHVLSGGQNQRVALARALVLQPRILLMDEPFGALDAQTREEMQELLAKLYNAQPCTIVFVTHDVSEALLLGDRVLVMSTQPATIVEDLRINEPRPRDHSWLLSADAQALSNKILSRLHAMPAGGQVRVTV
ncbi:MAG: ABC transporter ATP-binding protein [Betaproteobacteria bacterium]|nr:ABC transporter ATP-binding protein [Betaproteobacteria bacterium]